MNSQVTKTKIAVIVAGGKGERMHASVPKQFLLLKGRPVLMHTLEVFSLFDPEITLILVLPKNQIDFWKELCKKHAFFVKHTIVEGGDTRFHSVKNGLNHAALPALIAIHDGVRPLVSADTIRRCFETANEYGSAIPVVDMVESVRKITDNGNEAVDRAKYRLVQTPQVFDGKALLKAYNQDFSLLFTDDASVFETAGMRINLVDGNRENIKITTAMDLKIAEVLMA